MCCVAVDQAITNAALEISADDGDAVGLVLDTCFGPSDTVERYLRKAARSGPLAGERDRLFHGRFQTQWLVR